MDKRLVITTCANQDPLQATTGKESSESILLLTTTLPDVPLRSGESLKPWKVVDNHIIT